MVSGPASLLSAGGAGVIFEYRVGAVILAALLREDGVAGLSAHVVEVALQQGAAGSHLDDIVAFGRDADGSLVQVEFEVKRTLVPAARDPQWRSVISRCVAAVEADPGGIAGRRHLLGIAAREPRRELAELRELTELARTQADEGSLDRIVSTEDVVPAGLRQRWRALRDAVERACLEQGTPSGRQESSALAFRVASALWVWQVEVGGGEADHRDAVERLADLLQPGSRADAGNLFLNLIDIAQEIASRAGRVGRPWLLGELHQRGVPLRRDLDCQPAVKGHAFLSYVREDSIQADQLQRALENSGIQVWRDTSDLWPGEDWRLKIRSAITNDALVFIACFSRNSLARQASYQNEELVLAVEQLRLRRPEQPWLIPVRFDDSEIPDRDIGGGRMLSSLQRADLFGDRFDDGVARLVTGIRRILNPDAVATGAVAGATSAADDEADALPALIDMYGPLLDPELKAVVIETRKGAPASLVCQFNRHGDEVIIRRDMDFVGGVGGSPYFASAEDPATAAQLLLALDPYSLVMTTPLFSGRGGQLIADMYERAGIDDEQLSLVIRSAKSLSGGSTIDAVEGWIRRKLELPSLSLKLVSVQEHSGRFLLSLYDNQPLFNLRINDDSDDDYLDTGKHIGRAVVTQQLVQELHYYDVVEIGYRESPATWTTDGPRIRVSGMTPTEVPFEQFFPFEP